MTDSFTSKERTRRGHIMVLREILHHGTVETGAWEAAIRYAIHKLELQSPDETSHEWLPNAVGSFTCDCCGSVATSNPAAPCTGRDSTLKASNCPAPLAHGMRHCPTCGEELGEDGHHKPDPVPPLV